MTQCQHLFLVHAYHDGELPPNQVAVIEAHLRECPACAAELALLKEMSARFQVAPRPAVPLQFVSRIHQKIDQAGDVGARRLTWRLTAAAAAILVACLLTLNLAPAPAAEVAPTWETAAALPVTDTPEGAPPGDERQLAQWMRDDLSVRLALAGPHDMQGENP